MSGSKQGREFFGHRIRCLISNIDERIVHNRVPDMSSRNRVNPMIYIIPAAFVVALIGIFGFVARLDRQRKERYNAEVARVTALPLTDRLNELDQARREVDYAHHELRMARAAFNKSWGYRRNPFFSRLLIAQTAHEAAHEWVRKLEELCGIDSDAE